MQQREVARLGGEHGPDGEVEQEARAPGARVGQLERLERLAVERGRVGRGPRLARVGSSTRARRSCSSRLAKSAASGAGSGGISPVKCDSRAVVVEHLLALGVGLEGVDAECRAPGRGSGPARDRPTGRRPRPPCRRRARWLRVRPPTRSRASSTATEWPARDEVAGGAQPGQAGADDDDVDARAAGRAAVPGVAAGRRPRRRWRRAARDQRLRDVTARGWSPPGREMRRVSRAHRPSDTAGRGRDRPGTAGRRSAPSGRSGRCRWPAGQRGADAAQGLARGPSATTHGASARNCGLAPAYGRSAVRSSPGTKLALPT